MGHAKRTTIQYCTISLCLLLFFSCNSDGLYRQKISIPDSKWSYNNSLNFSWNIKDTLPSYDMELVIRHDNQLAYRNVYVKTYTHFPDTTEKKQLLSLELFDEPGNAYGQCSGGICTTPILLQSKLRFPQTGTYHLKIEQYGRDSILAGIQDFELRLKRNSD